MQVVKLTLKTKNSHQDIDHQQGFPQIFPLGF